MFLFRLSSLRDLTNDHYMHLSWAQQVLLGQLPGRDFVDPGMPLAWGLSATVQALAPGPFWEAALSACMFGIAAALTCWIVIRLSGSHIAAVLAAVAWTAFVPRLYNYPKVLVPALTIFLLQRYVEHRTRAQRLALGLGLAAAVLFRHDLGLYASVVAIVVIAITHRDSSRQAIRALVEVGVAAAVVLSPYLLYVEWSEGLFEHVRRGIEFSKGESHQLRYPWPTFTSLTHWGTMWSRDNATALLYYVAWLLPLASLAAMPGTVRLGDKDRLPIASAATLFLALYLPIILRYPLDQRLPDIATPLVIVGAFVGHAALRPLSRALFRREPALRVWGLVGSAIVIGLSVAVMLGAALLGGLTREIEETRIGRGPLGVVSKLRSVHQDGSVWPWTNFWPNSGGLPEAVLYVRACTTPDDFLLMTWPSPEYYFFAQRRFAAGHSMFLPPDAFTTDRDQVYMLDRLRTERPPIALVNKTLAEAFGRAYPMIAAYIQEHYTTAASFRHYDDDEIGIEIRNDLRATSSFGSRGWPCGLVSASGGAD